MARWVGAQGQVNSAIKAKTYPIMTSPTKKQAQINKSFTNRI